MAGLTLSPAVGPRRQGLGGMGRQGRRRADEPEMTRGEEILVAVDAAVGELDALRLVHYSEAGVRDVFVRSAPCWSGTSNRLPGRDGVSRHVDSLIYRLKQDGVAKADRDRLHRLRELYNTANSMCRRR